MVRIIVLFLILLTVPSANGEDLFSIDVDRILSVALNAAYAANPDIVPGDLIEKGENSALMLFCAGDGLLTNASKEEKFYRCQALVRLRVASTTKTTVTRKGKWCNTKTEFDEIRVRVWVDGRVYVQKQDSGTSKGGYSTYGGECPDTDNTE